MDSEGKITGYKTDVGGADTVFPFINTEFPEKITLFSYHICNISEGDDISAPAIRMSFVGDVYKYATVSLPSCMRATINSTPVSGNKTRIYPNKGVNTITVMRNNITNYFYDVSCTLYKS